MHFIHVLHTKYRIKIQTKNIIEDPCLHGPKIKKYDKRARVYTGLKSSKRIGYNEVNSSLFHFQAL